MRYQLQATRRVFETAVIEVEADTEQEALAEGQRRLDADRAGTWASDAPSVDWEGDDGSQPHAELGVVQSYEG